MATKIITDDTALQNIADAIRAKAGTTEPIAVGNMAQAITDIPSGGSTAIFNSIYQTNDYHNLTAADFPVVGARIRNHAFDTDATLENVVIPNGVTTIGDYAFYESLMHMTAGDTASCDLPATITSIGNYAFAMPNSVYENYSFLALTVRATTPPTLGTNVFQYRYLTTIKVPSASVSTYKSASGWSSYASKITAI